VVGLADRVTQLGRRWRGRQLGACSPGGGIEHRLETLEARIEHLDSELEGLQDAVYRRAVREDESIAELRRRMEPEQLERDLSRNARRRGR